MTDSSFFNPLDNFVQSWTTLALAPQKLMQSFNNGWSFGNVIINDNNSSAPQTEQAIVAVESYGRQLGKLLDAVDVLVERQPDAQEVKPFKEIALLKDKIDKVKHDMAVTRIDQLRGDLELLRMSANPADKANYEASIAALRALLGELPAKAN
jgi:hypothetical protein